MTSHTAPDLQILLATFNGERFLRPQLDSLLAQTYASFTILVRDDGSSDATLDILGSYARQHPGRIQILPRTAPTGAARLNFLMLMQAATAPYVCFADQDDIWLPSKLTLSMQAMQALERRHPPSTPLLVFTDLRIVDDQLNTIAPSMWRYSTFQPRSIHRLASMLGQSIVTGCTMTINRPLLDLARRMPHVATMHDRWISLLAASFGAAAFLPEQTVLYRQHTGNVVGATAPDTSLHDLGGKIRNNTGRRHDRERCQQQVLALLEVHAEELPPQRVRLLRAYLQSGESHSRILRLWLTLRNGFYRGGFVQHMGLLLELARARFPTPPTSSRKSA